jgi:effector-binding domain-containing protein
VIEAPRIVDLVPRPFAGLRLTIPKADIQRVMGPGLEEVHAALAAQGVVASGPWFTHHLRIEPQGWDFEIGVPVARPIAPAGRVAAREWPAMRAAQATLRGGYEGLAAGWGALDAWVAGRGLAACAELWESYAVGPESGPDPAGWRTELTRPLATA